MIRTKTSYDKTTQAEYPKLMVSTTSGLIVLFTNDKTGTVVHPNQMHHIGHWSDDWLPPCFKDYEGDLVLSND